MTVKKYLLSLATAAVLIGCGSDSDNEAAPQASSVDLPNGMTLVFYNDVTQDQYSVDTDADKATDMNTDPASNFYMKDKAAGRLLYWPDEVAEGDVDQKVVMLKQSYDYHDDGNLTHENLIYLGHFHGDELAAHNAEEFNPDSNTTNAAKQAALVRLNTYLAQQDKIHHELTEALASSGETLCNFFVPMHHDDHAEDDEHDDHEHNATAREEDHDHNATEEAVPHYAMSGTGKIYIYEEHEAGLEMIQQPVVLEGVDQCKTDESGIAGYGDYGILVFSGQTQTVYLVDAHGLDYHQHSKWALADFAPNNATMMIGIGEAEDHDH